MPRSVVADLEADKWALTPSPGGPVLAHISEVQVLYVYLNAYMYFSCMCVCVCVCLCVCVCVCVCTCECGERALRTVFPEGSRLAHISGGRALLAMY